MYAKYMIVGLIAAWVLAGTAYGGAWTLQRGQIQIISGVTTSKAQRGFDGKGNAEQRIRFEKTYLQNWMEYGLTDALTIFVAPECVTAASKFENHSTVQARDFSVEGGVRLLLSKRIGMLSLQASEKTAGAFDMSVSAGKSSGSRFELRLLYGRNFQLLRRNGFVDVEVAERWISRPRPNEAVIDVTAGFWYRPKALFMLQSFNTISGGAGQAPYTFYRQHKVQLSLVRKITPRWSLQIGVFASPAGQNIVAEQGVVTAVWYKI
jgi:protein XagA